MSSGSYLRIGVAVLLVVLAVVSWSSPFTAGAERADAQTSTPTVEFSDVPAAYAADGPFAAQSSGDDQTWSSYEAFFLDRSGDEPPVSICLARSPLPECVGDTGAAVVTASFRGGYSLTVFARGEDPSAMSDAAREAWEDVVVTVDGDRWEAAA